MRTGGNGRRRRRQGVDTALWQAIGAPTPIYSCTATPCRTETKHAGPPRSAWAAPAFRDADPTLPRQRATSGRRQLTSGGNCRASRAASRLETRSPTPICQTHRAFALIPKPSNMSTHLKAVAEVRWPVGASWRRPGLALSVEACRRLPAAGQRFVGGEQRTSSGSIGVGRGV